MPKDGRPSELKVLKTLVKLQGDAPNVKSSIAEVAGKSSLSTAATFKILQKLADKGLITRKSEGSRQAGTQFRVLAKGRNFLAKPEKTTSA